MPLPRGLYVVHGSHPCAAVERALELKGISYDVTDEAARADLLALPGHLDLVDGGIGAGTLGGQQPNAADLQIGSTVCLLLTLADLRPLIEGRPAAQLARRRFPDWSGEAPSGTLPADWIPHPSAPPAA